MKLSLFFLVFVLFVLAVSCATKEKRVIPDDPEERGKYVQQAVTLGFKLGNGDPQSAASYKRAWTYVQSLAQVDGPSDDVPPPHHDPLHVHKVVDPVPVPVPKDDGADKGGVVVGAVGDGSQVVVGKGGKGKKVVPKKKKAVSSVLAAFMNVLSELGYGILTFIPYQLSMWAAAEVFPDYSMMQQVGEHQYTKSVMNHSVVKPVFDFLSSGFTTYVLIVLAPFVAAFLGISAATVNFFRRAFFAASIGLLVSALADVGFQVASYRFPDEYLDTLANVAQYTETILFFGTMLASFFVVNFKKQVVVSLAGSLFILFWFHFIEDGKVHWDPTKTLPQSAAATGLQGMKQGVESAVEKGKKFMGKGDDSAKPSPAPAKSETTPAKPETTPEQTKTN